MSYTVFTLMNDYDARFVMLESVRVDVIAKSFLGWLAPILHCILLIFSVRRSGRSPVVT